MMELKIRFLEKSDLDTVSTWLEGWKLTPIEHGMYPETGLVLYDAESGKDVYMGFVWLSNSKLAQLGFITRNPFFKDKLPKDARFNFLNDLTHYARDLGAEYVITWTANKFLVDDFKKIGLKETSDRCSELLAKL